MTDGLGEPILMAFIAGHAVNKYHDSRSDDEIAFAATEALLEFAKCVDRDQSEAVGKEKSGEGVGTFIFEFKPVENLLPLRWITENKV